MTLIVKNIYGQTVKKEAKQLLKPKALWFYERRMSEDYEAKLRGIRAKFPSSEQAGILRLKNSIATPDLSYTWDGDITAEIMQYAPVISPLPWTQFFTFMPNRSNKGKLNVAEALEFILARYTSCNGTWSNANSIIRDVAWECKNMGFKLKFCIDVFESTVFSDLLASDVDRTNVFGTAVQAMIDRLLFSALERDFSRVTMCGSTAVGVDAKYNQMDGVFKRLFALEAAQIATPPANPNDKMNVVEITSLSLADADSPLRWLRELVRNASPVLRKAIRDSKVDYQGEIRNVAAFIRVNEEFEAMYRDYLTNKELLVAGDTQMVINGVQVVAFDGIPVIADFELSQSLTDPDNPFFGNDYLGYLSVPENWLMIASQENAYGQIRGHFSEDFDENRFKANFLTDIVFVQPGMNALMYGIVEEEEEGGGGGGGE